MDPVDGDPTPAELMFLSKLGRIGLSEEEEADLLKPTCEEEISQILQFDVDLDSSPGEDGITYRMMSRLWDFPSAASPNHLRTGSPSDFPL